MKMLGIYNSTNKRFRKDGDEFQREAFNWRYASEIDDEVSVANVKDGRVRRRIRHMTNGLDVLAIFDHGTPKGLPRMRENLGNVKGLAATIASVTKKITIILYSCSCGRGWWGKFGFRWMNKKNKADMIVSGNYSPRDGYAIALYCELAKLGVAAEVWAHLTKGHTTRNPHVVSGGIRGHNTRPARLRHVTPGTPEWKQWKRDLKGPLRFTFWR